jgi:hypothetical protein
MVLVPENFKEEAGKVILEVKKNFKEGEDETGQPG